MRCVALRLLAAVAVFSLPVFSALAQGYSTNFGSARVNALYLHAPAPQPPGGENVYSPDQASVFVSAFLGINHNTNMGTFRTDCDCDFNPERRSFNLGNIGMLAGVDITYQFHPSWAVIAKGFYDNKHTKEAYQRQLQTPISTGENQQVIIRDVTFEEVGTVTLSYFTFGVFGRYQPRLERWYVFVGPAVGIPSASSLDHNQEIVTSELSYKDPDISDVQRNVSTADFKGDIRMEAMLGFGYDYIVRPRWFVNPELRVGFPFSKITTNVSDRGKDIPIDDWKVLSVQFSIGLKYEAF